MKFCEIMWELQVYSEFYKVCGQIHTVNIDYRKI